MFASWTTVALLCLNRGFVQLASKHYQEARKEYSKALDVEPAEFDSRKFALLLHEVFPIQLGELVEAILMRLVHRGGHRGHYLTAIDERFELGRGLGVIRNHLIGKAFVFAVGLSGDKLARTDLQHVAVRDIGDEVLSLGSDAECRIDAGLSAADRANAGDERRSAK